MVLAQTRAARPIRMSDFDPKGTSLRCVLAAVLLTYTLYFAASFLQSNGSLGSEQKSGQIPLTFQ